MDLTKIEKPFGLLDEATQKALRECGGPWEIFTERGWEDNTTPIKRWSYMVTRRQKPQPPKPREWWIITDWSGHAYEVSSRPPTELERGHRAIHVREVIE